MLVILSVIILMLEGPVFSAMSLIPASITTMSGFKSMTSGLNLINI